MSTIMSSATIVTCRIGAFGSAVRAWGAIQEKLGDMNKLWPFLDEVSICLIGLMPGA
jgi:hypothetical protein